MLLFRKTGSSERQQLQSNYKILLPNSTAENTIIMARFAETGKGLYRQKV